MPAQFTDPSIALRAVQADCERTEIGMKHYGKTFLRPELTGDTAADIATLTEYRNALQTSFLSISKN